MILLHAFINKGELVEAFVGQEILAYSDPIAKEALFYWRRESRASQAEIDYLVQIKDQVVPIEVKAGQSKRIKSMQIFLDSHPNCTYGLRFSADNYSTYQKIVSYPLYAVVKAIFRCISDFTCGFEKIGRSMTMNLGDSNIWYRYQSVFSLLIQPHNACSLL